MAPSPVVTPLILTDPGYLFIAPLASTLNYSTTVESITVAEFFDPITYRTTERGGSIAFNLADWTLTNYRRAINGGVAALAATSGTDATSLGTLEPPDPGSEVRSMIGWESLDNTVRFVARQTIQGGEISSAFNKAPAKALIPCTFNMEVPTAAKPWIMWSAGADRLA